MGVEKIRLPVEPKASGPHHRVNQSLLTVRQKAVASGGFKVERVGGGQVRLLHELGFAGTSSPNRQTRQVYSAKPARPRFGGCGVQKCCRS